MYSDLQGKLVLFKAMQSHSPRHQPGFYAKFTRSGMELENVASRPHVSKRSDAARMHAAVCLEDIRGKPNALAFQPIESGP